MISFILILLALLFIGGAVLDKDGKDIYIIISAILLFFAYIF